MTDFCFWVGDNAKGQRVLRIRKTAGAPAQGATSSAITELPLESAAHEDAAPSLWPLVIRLAGGKADQFIIGMITTERAAREESSAMVSQLWLYRIDNAGDKEAKARLVLSAPHQAKRIIKVCLKESDKEARAGACEDELDMETMLVLDDAGSENMPGLLYHAAAQTYPSDFPLRARDRDQPWQLSKADLVRRHDPVCSYKRKLTFDAAAGRYIFDQPPPDCSAYTGAP